MPVFDLLPHPGTPPPSGRTVRVQVIREDSGALSLIFSVGGDQSMLAWPPRDKPRRADELWRTTCFELFVRTPAPGYMEFNFSPSANWAAYVFEDYRSGMRPLGIDENPLLDHPPGTWVEDGADVIGAHFGVSLGIVEDDALLGLSAVIEERDGAKSYWALAHPPGSPDFHDPACFAARVPAVGDS